MAKSTTAAVAAIVCVLFSCTAGQHSQTYNNNQEIQDLVGQECSPPFGYLRHTCGPEILLNETVVPGPVYLHGPNTCRITKISQTNELDYAYRKQCNYYLSGYRYVHHCHAVCLPTTTCNSERNQTIERSNFECCPGFAVRPAEDQSHYEYIYRLYYTPIPVLPVGCPRADGANIQECLMILGLTEFSNFASMTDFYSMFVNTSGVFTVFAPTNAAIEAVRSELEGLSADELALVVGNHIIDNRAIQESNLGHNLRLMTASNTTLHSTNVVYGDRSLVYNPDYSNHFSASQLIRYTNIPFINGARIVNTDACAGDDVTLQVIDRVLMPGMETIAMILASDPSLSMFTEALMFTKVFDFLGKEDISRTIFVPTNEAFAAQIPDDLLACLMYRRLPLSDLVLYHISDAAEYTPSLSLRGFTYTLLQYHVIQLTTSPEGVITFNNNPPSNIVVANIPASNGVIHVVDSVLIAPNMDFGMCSDLVPTTMPPATTPAPTTMPPTMPPATTMPPPVVTTEAEMTTLPDETTDAAAGGIALPFEPDIPDELLRQNP